MKQNKICKKERIIALCGNPNVGKSTLFNSLTGLNQHTGNWAGKTVDVATGKFSFNNISYKVVDLPGTYSLVTHSAEEEVARDFLIFEKIDAVIVVCDATCLERNLNLVLQTLEITKNVIVCINLLDEAHKKGIRINLKQLEQYLGVPVVGLVARRKKTLHALQIALDKLIHENTESKYIKINYPEAVENAIALIEPTVTDITEDKISPRLLSLKLLNSPDDFINKLTKYLLYSFKHNKEIYTALNKAKNNLMNENINSDKFEDMITSSLILYAEKICNNVVKYKNPKYTNFDRKIDKIITGKYTAYPIMLFLLLLILWITITGANYPSALLAEFFTKSEPAVFAFFETFLIPNELNKMLTYGVYRVLSWVISVMLPPMAIFFPFFTLLEDIGFLPRIAFNLDKHFKNAKTCGKQALTMCMGFGCNAAGVVGCRIIDSPRERIVAMITNSFVPCNGRFPTLIAIITMFFVGFGDGFGASLLSAFILTGIIVLGVASTFFVSRILSLTLLKGVPSTFTLELPPYRSPQVGKILVRSIIDRTLFVLGRAIVVAAPAGAIIWFFANTYIGDLTILSHLSIFLDPIGEIMGLDGMILLAFILGFPANEIVIPILLMGYMSGGMLIESDNLFNLHKILTQNGWTVLTAINTMLFSLFHFPCSTTLLSIKKESKSNKYTLWAFLIPTIFGFIICCVTTFIYNLLF